jgi:glycosyltransferase involved in cell wall biosynthesis
MPKYVRIIIVCYNQEKYLRQAIESVIDQDYQYKEICFVDDCSTDDSISIAEEYADKYSEIVIHHNENNLGLADNYKQALHLPTSAYLTVVLDSDDYYSDNKFISKAVDLFEKYDDLALVIAKSRMYFEQSDTFLEEHNNDGLPELIDGNDFFLDFPNGRSFPHRNCIYVTQKAKDIGFYNCDSYSLDWESFLRLVLDNKMAFIDEYVSVYRQHHTNTTLRVDLNSLFEDVAIMEKPFEYASEHSSLSKEALDKWRMNMLKRQFIKNYLKLDMSNKKLIPEYMERLRDYDSKVYSALTYSPKVILYNIIKHIPCLLKIVFKHVLKSEFFLLKYGNK